MEAIIQWLCMTLFAVLVVLRFTPKDKIDLIGTAMEKIIRAIRNR